MDLCFVFMDKKAKLDGPGGSQKMGLKSLTVYAVIE